MALEAHRSLNLTMANYVYEKMQKLRAAAVKSGEWESHHGPLKWEFAIWSLLAETYAFANATTLPKALSIMEMMHSNQLYVPPVLAVNVAIRLAKSRTSPFAKNVVLMAKRGEFKSLVRKLERPSDDVSEDFDAAFDEQGV